MLDLPPCFKLPLLLILLYCKSLFDLMVHKHFFRMDIHAYHKKEKHMSLSKHIMDLLLEDKQ
jgi:hypothetical protein